MSENINQFRVGVFSDTGKRKRRYRAYVRDYNPQWKGCCEHTVEAASGEQANWNCLFIISTLRHVHQETHC